jgi:hypothetical protein
MYRAIKLCFVCQALRKEGETFEYNGPENTNLEPLDAPKPAAKEPAAKETADRKWTPKAKRAAGDAEQGEA